MKLFILCAMLISRLSNKVAALQEILSSFGVLQFWLSAEEYEKTTLGNGSKNVEVRYVKLRPSGW